MVRHEQGQFEVALQHYRQALQLRPDYAKAHSNLGVLLQAQGQLSDAWLTCSMPYVSSQVISKPTVILGVVLQAQGHVERCHCDV